jgi:hypothetical protein
VPTINLLAAVLSAVVAALTAGTVAGAAERPVLMEGFERPLHGWRGHGARVERAAGGVQGRHAARLVATGAATTFSLRAPDPVVVETVRGAVYRARAWVRSDRPGRRVCLRIQERRGRGVVAGARSCLRGSRRWRRIPPLTFRARGDGHDLTLGLHQDVGRRGESFEADGIALTTTPAPPPDSARWSSRTLPPGSALPSGAECAGRVSRSPREPRPRNDEENRTSGTRLELPADVWVDFPSWRERATRVDGRFTGTTDELIQWASCKWGFGTETTRAQAHVESGWSQDFLGDGGLSVGLLQVKAAAEGTPHRYTWPHSRRSTAFNLDYALAWRRACYEGDFAEGGWLPESSRGDLWSCVGLWYSGLWQEGDDDYVAAVRTAVTQRPWLRYEPPEG